MKEEVIISIDIDKGASEKEVDNLTKKINELTAANKNLAEQNKQLAKAGQENSKEYLENTRQIEINKQKIAESTASRKGLIQTIIAEDDSIKALNIRNAELKKKRDQISTSTAEGRAKIAEINEEMEKNNETIVKNSNAMEKQKFNIGNYKSALDGIVPGLGGMIDGIEGATKAGLTFIATPIGAVLAAIALALAAVTQYFKRTEEGGDQLNEMLAVMSALWAKVLDAAAAVGKAIVQAIENPKQAIRDFGQFLQNQIVNRFVGMLELFPKLGEAVSLLFEGKFVEAAKVATDATGKVILGIENTTEVITGFIKSVTEEVNEAVKLGQKMAAIDKLLGDQEEALTVQRAKTALEVSKIREKALNEELENRKAVLLQAIDLEKQLSDAEVEHAKTRLEQAKLQQQIDGINDESKLAIAKAEADVLAAETSRFQNTIKFRKEIAAIDEEIRKRTLAAQKEINEVRLKNDIEQADSVEQRVEREITLEEYQTQLILDNEHLLASEREAIQVASEDRKRQIRERGNADMIAEQAALRDVLLQANAEAIQAEIAQRQAVLDTFIGMIQTSGDYEKQNLEERTKLYMQQEALKIEALNQRIAYEQEQEQNAAMLSLANEDLTETQRQIILEQSQAKQNAIVTKGEADRYKVQTDTDKKIAEFKAKLREQEIQGAYAVANAGLGLLREIFGENKAFAAAQAGLNTAQGITNALAMSGPPWVGIAMSIIIGALGAVQIAKIAGIEFAKGGLLAKKFFTGGISKIGGILSGPSHARGGIPFTVGGRPGFEAEGGEAIINKRSTAMFRKELSAINQAGGGVAFARGGMTSFAAGSMIAASSTRQAATQAESNFNIRRISEVISNLPPPIVSVVDINERAQEYDSNVQNAVVI
jgi:hypothetical protein